MSAAVQYLRSPLAIRSRCEAIFEAGLAGQLRHFAIDLSKLPMCADRVATVTRQNYPTLAIPVHGRMNHFRAGGVDRVAPLRAAMHHLSADDQTRAMIDLIVVSVLLDAGAGDAWRFRDAATNMEIARSEGLAVASLRAFEAGVFANDGSMRVDSQALIALDPAKLAAAFQVSAHNPLAGADGRIGLVKQLGHALQAASRVFPGGRPGGIFDYLRAKANRDFLHASEILDALLTGLGAIWPGRLTVDGVNLGDVWQHPAAGGSGATAGLVPFHKLSQWLAYSLFEPLQQSGISIMQPGALTGLPEYRNGGLFFDMGVLVAKHGGVTTRAHLPSDELIVEWRALTVALLDRIADPVRQRLGKTPDELPLANILEGGTWATGRVLAKSLRPGGGSPIAVISDGTVF